jgi:hypothetical protein
VTEGWFRVEESSSNDIEAIEDAGERTTSPTPADLLNRLLGSSDISELDALSWQMKEMAREHQRALEPESLPETLDLLWRLAVRAEKQNQDKSLAPGLELVVQMLSELVANAQRKAKTAAQPGSA